MRRFLGWLLAATLVALDLALAAWLLRRPLFEDLVRRIAARELTAVLGADVEIGAIGGNWWSTISIQGVQWRGRPGDFVRQVHDLRIDAALSPTRLLQGDPTGLLGARITAARVMVDLDGRLPGSGDTGTRGEQDSGTPFDPMLLLRLLPRGAAIQVADLDVGSAGERRRGPLRAALGPDAARRRLLVTHDRLTADWELGADTTGAPQLGGSLRVAEPGQFLACVGLPHAEPRVEGGQLRLVATVGIAPLRLSGTLAVTDLERDGARLQDSAIAIHCDERTLTVPTARIDLVGIRLSGEGLVLPSPFGQASIGLRDVAGRLELQIADLEPYRHLLPAEVAQLLPLQGYLRGFLDDGLLRLDDCRLRSPDVVLQVDAGMLPLAAVDPRRQRDLQLQFAIDVLASRWLRIADLELVTSGRIHGALTGSLDDPQVRAEVDLGATTLAGHAAERLRATVGFGDGALLVTGLDADGLLPPRGAPAGSVGGSVRGGGRVTFARDDAALRIDADLTATATGAWLAAAGLEATLVQRVQPFAVNVKGEVFVPALGSPLVKAAVQVDDLVVDALPAAALDAELAFDGAGLRIERCRVRAPAELELAGVLPLDGAGGLSLRIAASEQDLTFWTSLLLATPLRCRGALAVTAGGTLRAPVVELAFDGSLDDPAPLLQWWPHEVLGPPLTGPLQGRLRARHDARGVAIEQCDLVCGQAAGRPWRAEMAGTVPLRWQDGDLQQMPDAGEPLRASVAMQGVGTDKGLPRWRLAAALAADSRALRLERLDLSVGDGTLSGGGALAAGFARLLQRDADWAAVAVDGSWQLASLRLERLPAHLLPDGTTVVEGSLTGTLEISGTLAEPRPVLDVQLDDAQLRLPGMPRITRLSARLQADPRRVHVETRTAELGAAPVALSATLASGDGDWTALERVAVTARLTGQQALLVHTSNLKLRGDVDLRLDGTLAAMKLHGETNVTNGRFAQRITALPGFDAVRARGGRSDSEDVVLNLLGPPWGPRVEFDVRVLCARPIEVRTHAVDTDLRADLRLLGDAANARLVGTVAGSSGTLRLPGTTMSLRSLLVTFAESDPLRPTLRVQAEGRRHGYQVQLLASGPTTSPEIVLTSVPALPAADLLVLVSTGMLPERLQGGGTRGQAALVGSYLAQELAAWYLGDETTEAGGETFFDRFTVESGREISASGLETLLFEFRLTKLLSLQAERDVYEDYNGGVVLRWRFR